MPLQGPSNTVDSSSMSKSLKRALGVGQTEAEYNNGVKFVTLSLDDNTKIALDSIDRKTEERAAKRARIELEQRERNHEHLQLTIRRGTPACFRAPIHPSTTVSETPANMSILTSKPTCHPDNRPAKVKDALVQSRSNPRTLINNSFELFRRFNNDRSGDDCHPDISSPLYIHEAVEPRYVPQNEIMHDTDLVDDDGFMDVDGLFDDSQSAGIATPGYGTVPCDGLVSISQAQLQETFDVLKALPEQYRLDTAPILAAVDMLNRERETLMNDFYDLKHYVKKNMNHLLIDMRMLASITGGSIPAEEAEVVPMLSFPGTAVRRRGQPQESNQ